MRDFLREFRREYLPWLVFCGIFWVLIVETYVPVRTWLVDNIPKLWHLGQAEIVLKTMDDEKLKAFLAEKEFKNIHRGEGGNLTGDFEGSRVIFEYDEDRLKVFSIVEDFDPDRFAELNRWNNERRYSKAFVNEDGQAILMMDFYLKKGVTPEAIKDFLGIFQVALQDFQKERVLSELLQKLLGADEKRGPTVAL